jgi:3-phenylpropionate/trans-cinnamate dioxygenase ferredoxin subunit
MVIPEVNPEEYKFYAVARDDEIIDGDRWFIEIGTTPIILLKANYQLYAIGDVCTHDGGQLGDGELTGCEIKCPRHGARFDIRSGKALSLPAVKSVPVYPVRVVDGNIEIGLPLKKND